MRGGAGGLFLHHTGVRRALGLGGMPPKAKNEKVKKEKEPKAEGAKGGKRKKKRSPTHPPPHLSPSLSPLFSSLLPPHFSSPKDSTLSFHATVREAKIMGRVLLESLSQARPCLVWQCLVQCLVCS